MASDPSDLAWASKANEARSRLPDPDVDRNDLGELILERLTTFGPFYQKLADERRYDATAQAKQEADEPAPTPATFATLTLGGLKLTAGIPGAAGNALRALVTPGLAQTFRPTTIDPDASARQLRFAVDALSGAVAFLSDDPEVAALQQQAAAFLASLDEATRAEAESTIRARWDDARVARGTLEPPRIREATEQACKDIGLTDDDVASPDSLPDDATEILEQADLSPLLQQPKLSDAMAIFDGVEEQKAAGAASVFNLTVSNNSAAESFTEIASGYDFALRNSVLVGGFAWLSSDRPPDGEYQFTGGADAVESTGKIIVRAAKDYVFRLDAFRSYTLPELEAIVSDAMSSADDWLA